MTALVADAVATLLPDACLHCEQAEAVKRAVSSRALAIRIIHAQEEERARIARELHDDAGQSLTLIMLRLRVLEELLNEPVARGEVAEVRTLVGETLDGVRRLASDLGPAVLKDLGLAAALEPLVTRVRGDSLLDLTLHVGEDTPVVRGTTALALYRVAQEALTNVLRHAQACHAEIALDRVGSAVRLVVRDDGHGFDAPDVLDADHVGLIGMRERIELVGGAFELRSHPGRGTRVSAIVPVNA